MDIRIEHAESQTELGCFDIILVDDTVPDFFVLARGIPEKYVPAVKKACAQAYASAMVAADKHFSEWSVEKIRSVITKLDT